MSNANSQCVIGGRPLIQDRSHDVGITASPSRYWRTHDIIGSRLTLYLLALVLPAVATTAVEVSLTPLSVTLPVARPSSSQPGWPEPPKPPLPGR